MLVGFRRKVIPTLTLLLKVVVVEEVVDDEIVARVSLLPQDQNPSQMAVDIGMQLGEGETTPNNELVKDERERKMQTTS